MSKTLLVDLLFIAMNGDMNTEKIQSSNFWVDFESDTYELTYSLKLENNFKSNSIISFYAEYISISNKYGIGMPWNNMELSKKKDNMTPLEMKSIFNGFFAYNNFTMYIPSNLFIYKNNEIVVEEIIDTNSLTTLKDAIKTKKKFCHPPLSIRCFASDLFFGLQLSISNDVFFSKLDNSKTKAFFTEKTSSVQVDNSELAVLNTSRLNSYLRDLKQLCLSFGLSDFIYNNSYDLDGTNLPHFSENGVLVDNSLIFYEDYQSLFPINMSFNAK